MWVAEGLGSRAINQRAAEFDPPFSVSRPQVTFYRQTRHLDIQAMIRAEEYDALNAGLSIKTERVSRLQALAALMEEDLLDGSLWLDDVKGVGSGDIARIVEFKRFNQAEVEQYRATLDQIAEEVGDKKPGLLIPSEITVRFVKSICQ